MNARDHNRQAMPATAELMRSDPVQALLDCFGARVEYAESDDHEVGTVVEHDEPVPMHKTGSVAARITGEREIGKLARPKGAA